MRHVAARAQMQQAPSTLLQVDRSERLTLELGDACMNGRKQQCGRQLQTRQQVGFRVFECFLPPG